MGASDCTKERNTDFLDSMNSNQFKEVENFFESMPKLSHTVKITNPNTKVESDIVLEGLASFFGYHGAYGSGELLQIEFFFDAIP